MKYSVVRYDSAREFDQISNVSNDTFSKEEDAREVMKTEAKKFAEREKGEGNLININKLSENSVRIDYVDVVGKEAFVIFQVFER